MSGEQWSELHFDNCRIPAENVLLGPGGFKKQMASFNVERLGNTARSLAFGRYCFERAREHAGVRQQFGRPLAEFQGLQWKFADSVRRFAQAHLEKGALARAHDPRFPFDVAKLMHGVTVEDPYAWLRDPGYPQVNDPDVLGYLNAENSYFEAAMKPHRGLIDTLFAEMKGRLKDDESSVPQKDGAYVYWHAFDSGAEYRKWYRRPVGGGDEAVILDEPALAKGHEYFRLGGHAVSPDGRLLAYAVDTNGSERFVLKVRDLETGAELPDMCELRPTSAINFSLGSRVSSARENSTRSRIDTTTSASFRRSTSSSRLRAGARCRVTS